MCYKDQNHIYYLPTVCKLQILTNVLVALMGVILRQVAATMMGVTPALATVDTQAMDSPAEVSHMYTPLHIMLCPTASCI